MLNKSVNPDCQPNIDDILNEKIHLINNIKQLDDKVSKIQANCKHNFVSNINNIKRTVEERCSKCNLIR